MTIGDIDPVGGLLGLAGLGFAVIAFFTRKAVRNPAIARRLKILARISIVVACVGVAILIAAFSYEAFKRGGESIELPPTANPNSSQPLSTPAITTPATTTPSLAPTPSPSRTGGWPTGIATQKVTRLEILTIKYRRLNLEGTVYAAYPGGQDLDFRFGWTAHTDSGPLQLDNCVVKTKLSRADGTVLKSSPSNYCSRTIGSYDYREVLGPGEYIIEVSLQTADGATLAEQKNITIQSG